MKIFFIDFQQSLTIY